MYQQTTANLTQNLKHELASVISDFKAYEVPAVCLRLGLADGSEDEAFQSKYKYVSKRLASLGSEPLIEKAHALLEDIDAFNLREAVEKVMDLKRPEITKLTRRRLINQLAEGPLVSEVEEYAFISSVLPLQRMPAPNQTFYSSLEEYLLQHTVRNDDLNSQEYLESLGLLSCSTSFLFYFLEQLTSPEYQNEERQKDLYKKIDALLRHDSYTLSAVGRISGSPIYRVVAISNKTPADLDITEALIEFDPDQIGDRWQKALDSRTSDPERAITLARTLLEDVCKWILHQADESWDEKDDLPALYKKLSKALKLAPDDYTEQIFKQILSGCQSVVSALGSIRNKLGDAHSIGPKRVKPATRHAELAVNLSGAMARFLVSTWKARQDKSEQ